MNFKYCISSILVLILCLKVQAQSKTYEIYPNRYDVKNGLADNNIVDGLLDAKNTLWVATSKGVSYFNEGQFVNYNTSELHHKINGESITSLTLVGNKLYAASAFGIDMIDVNTKQSFTFLKTSKDNQIVKLFTTSKNQLIGVSRKGVVTNFTTQKSITIPLRSEVYYLTEDDNDHLLLSNFENKIYSITISKFDAYELFYQNAKEEFYGIYFLKSRGLIKMANGVILQSPATKKETLLLSKKNRNYIHLFAPIDNDHYLTADRQPQFLYNTFGSEDRYQLKLQLLDNVNITKLIMGPNKTVIVLSSYGLYTFKLPNFYINKIDDHLLSNKVIPIVRRAMVETQHHDVVLCSYNGLQLFHPKTNKVEKLLDSMLLFYSATIDNDKVWLGTEGNGLYEYDLTKRTLSNAFKIIDKKTFATEHIFSIFNESQNKLLLGYQFPFGLWEFDKITNQFSKIDFGYGAVTNEISIIRHISKSRNGHFWIGTDKGLFELDENKKPVFLYNNVKHDQADNLPDNYINFTFHKNDSLIWIATNKGMALLNTKSKKVLKKLSTEQNLPSDRCLSIFEDGLNRLWVSSYNGISCIDENKSVVNNYFIENGLIDNEYNYPSYLQTQNGEIFFGGLNGTIQIKPNSISSIKANNDIYIKEIVHEKNNVQKIIDFAQYNQTGFTLTRNMDIVTIQFGFAQFIDPVLSKYFYKIEGLQQDWIPLGNIGNVRLWNLPIGNYNLKIKGVNGEGITNSNLISIPLHVEAIFYETPLFKILISSGVLFLIVSFFYFKFRQIQSIQSIKTQMLNDIHDEVGSILTKTAMKAEVANLKHGSADKDLLDIQKFSREAVQSLRNLLWSIGTEKQTTTDFEDRIQSWLQFLFSETNIDFQFINHIPNFEYPRSIALRRNVFLVIKELAHNTLKHSNATIFKVELNYKNKHFVIHISDNGTNDDNAINNNGFGIKSVRSRILQLKGEVDFNKGQSGFFVEIKIPIN